MEVRQPAGPKPTIKNRRTINVSLTDESIEKARKIGYGNVSAGVREAVETYQRADLKVFNDAQ